MSHDHHFKDPRQTWDARYGGDDFLFGKAPNVYLAAQRHLLAAAQSALAVADGEGRNSVWLAEQQLQVDAFDISPVALAKAARLARQRDVRVALQLADCDEWEWHSQAYDVVVAIFVQFAGPAMRRRLFAGMVSTLKPGGYLIVQGYTPKQLDYNTGGPGVLEHLYTADMMRAAFGALDIIELREYETVLGEGAQHAGPSALLGMVARKPGP
ncbi:class I SAM-dependent methyltransferase [Massilia sp. PWRC2]|uniref:class I SAM-dependent methyltransferase n=1 Tax=Massilia sp. PWRC2 TaxID=2804626 RepID=UPI003CEDC726